VEGERAIDLNKYWTTRNGRIVAICDMDDQHLVNTIRMLEREVYGFGVSDDYGVDFEEEDHPSLAPLKAEARRRKLEV